MEIADRQWMSRAITLLEELVQDMYDEPALRARQLIQEYYQIQQYKDTQ